MKDLIFAAHCLLALLIISPGCTKDPPKPGVAGLITEFGTDKPINNAGVRLLCKSLQATQLA